MGKPEHLIRQVVREAGRNSVPFRTINNPKRCIDPKIFSLLHFINTGYIANGKNRAFIIRYHGKLYGISAGTSFAFASSKELHFWVRSLGNAVCYDLADALAPFSPENALTILDKSTSLQSLPDYIEDALLNFICHRSIATLVFYGNAASAQNNLSTASIGRGPPEQENPCESCVSLHQENVKKIADKIPLRPSLATEKVDKQDSNCVLNTVIDTGLYADINTVYDSDFSGNKRKLYKYRRLWRSMLKKFFNYLKYTGLLLASSFKISNAQNLTVKTYDDLGNVLSGAQVTAKTKTGNLRGWTNASGLVSFPNVNDSLEVVVAKDNYIGAAHKLFVDSDLTFSTPLINKTQIRNGKNGTGIDTINAQAYEMISVHDVRKGSLKENPILRDASTTWPNLDVPVEVTGFNSTDSTYIWNTLNWANDFYGVTIFKPGNVKSWDDKGIRMISSGGYVTSNSTQNGFIFHSNCYARPSPDLWDYGILHEDNFHALTNVGDHVIAYSPTNFWLYTTDRTQTKDAIYMYLGYKLQHLRQTGKSELNMADYSDTIVVTPNHAPEKPIINTPTNNQQFASRSLPVDFSWTGSDSDGDRLNYTAKIFGPKDTTVVTSDSMFTIPGNILSRGNYKGVIEASDNELTSISDTVNFNIKNTSPSIIKSIDNITMTEGSSKIVDVKGNYFDLDNDIITTSVQGPNGLNLSVANDTIRMFAQLGYFGSADVIVTYDDNHGGTAVDTFNVNVIKSIVKPYVASALRDTTQHKNISNILLSSNVRDNIKGDVVQYAVSSTHGIAKLSNDSLTFTPDHGFTGIANVILSGYNSTDTTKTSSNIQINNTAPSVLVTSPQNGDSIKYNNQNIKIVAKATDRDGDPLTLTARIKEYNGTLDSLITMVDTLANISSSKLKSNSRYDITVYATDGTDTTKSNTISVYTSTLTGIKNIVEDIPKSFELYQNYPNPFNPTTRIKYEVQRGGFISLKVYDLLGREVSVLLNEDQAAGTYSVTWNASRQASGVYFYRLDAGDFHQTKMMVLQNEIAKTFGRSY